MRQIPNVIFTPQPTQDTIANYNFEDIRKALDAVIKRLENIENRLTTLEAE